jgi:3-hydroxy-3-methylglutaryl CoA synthase
LPQWRRPRWHRPYLLRLDHPALRRPAKCRHRRHRAEPAGRLCVAADKRQARPGSTQELIYGVGAAALTVGDNNVLAELIGQYSITEDFVDHYRGDGRKFDYFWEERWVRQEGHLKLIPAAIAGLLEKTGVAADAIDRTRYRPIAGRPAPPIR